MERKLISACIQSRNAYEELLSTGEDGQNFSDQGKIIFEEIQRFYNKDPASNEVDKDILISYLKRKLPSEKQFTRFKELIDSLVEVSVANVLGDYIDMRKHDIGNELAQALLSNNDKKVPYLMEKWNEFNDEGIVINEEEEIYTGLDPEQLIEDRKPENLIRIYPKILNEKLDGGAMRGDHILISGRIEDGKSLLAINMAIGCVLDGHRVLYIGNEDSAKRMRPRMIARITGMTKNEQIKNPEKCREILKEHGHENFTFASIPDGTFTQIEGLIGTYNPDVLVIDQARNINVGIEEGSKQLEKIAKGIRRLIKKHNILGISVTQSNNDVARANKVICGMEDIDSSKVGLPGQADLVIMIGSNERMRAQGIITINLPKNKLSGWHGNFSVEINPLLSKVVGI